MYAQVIQKTKTIIKQSIAGVKAFWRKFRVIPNIGLYSALFVLLVAGTSSAAVAHHQATTPATTQSVAVRQASKSSPMQSSVIAGSNASTTTSISGATSATGSTKQAVGATTKSTPTTSSSTTAAAKADFTVSLNKNTVKLFEDEASCPVATLKSTTGANLKYFSNDTYAFDSFGQTSLHQYSADAVTLGICPGQGSQNPGTYTLNISAVDEHNYLVATHAVQITVLQSLHIGAARPGSFDHNVNLGPNSTATLAEQKTSGYNSPISYHVVDATACGFSVSSFIDATDPSGGNSNLTNFVVTETQSCPLSNTYNLVLKATDNYGNVQMVTVPINVFSR